MELPQLEKFCFKLSLRTGCITMGTINSILTLILGLILIPLAEEVKTTADSLKRDDTDGVSSYRVAYTIMVLLIVLLFIKFLFDWLFIFAVVKDKPGIIRKYCVFWIIFMVLFLFAFLKTIFYLGAGYVIAHLFYLGENLYYIIVIRSYLLSIHEDGVL